MRGASERHQFEEAARSRNRLMAVRHLSERQAVAVGTGTYDAVALAVEGDVANVQLLAVRGGRIEERRSHYLENADAEGEDELLARFLLDYYDTQVGIPPLICVPPRGRRRRPDRRLPLPAPRRGGRAARGRARRQAARRRHGAAQRRARRAPRRAARAAHAHAPHRGARGAARERSTSRRCRSASSASTSRTCRTRTPSPRWSCSRTAPRSAPSTAASASATTGGQDDFRSLAEAVTRRFERYRRVDEDGYDRSFATLPNLLVIDGGKGQLGAALDAMRSFDLPRVAVVSLAKREEEVYLPGRSQPVLLPRESPGLQLLQQVRDEAHRFALRGHRTRRAAGQTASLLDTLPGVGPVRRSGADRALRRRRAPARRVALGARGRARPAGGRGAARSTTTCTASVATALSRSRVGASPWPRRPSPRVSRRSPTASRAGAPASSCCAATARCCTSCRGRRARRRACATSTTSSSPSAARATPPSATSRPSRAISSGRRVNFGADALGLERDVRRARATPTLERAIAHALAGVAVGRARLLRRARGPRRPAARAARRRRVLRALPARALPAVPTASSARDGSLGEYGSHGVRLQAAAARARGARREPAPRSCASSALGGGTGLSTLLRGLKLDRRADHGDRHADRRRRLERPPAPRPRDAAAGRHPQLPDRAGRGRVAHEPPLPAPLRPRRAGRPRLRQHLPGRADRGRRLVRRRRREVGRVLAIEGSVVPATTHPAALLAEMDDGRYVAGETAVARDRHGVRRLFLSPADAVANPQALAAVERADLIVLGPGSLFTSTLPPLLVPGLGRAVLNARGLRVYVCNLLQQPGETIGYRASHHVERLHQHVGARVVDSVMVPRRAIVSREDPGRVRPRAPGRARRARRGRADRRAGRLPPRPRGARTRARARRPAPRAQRPCRSLRTSAPSSRRCCRRRRTAGWPSSPASCATPAPFHLLAGGAVEVHVDLASSLAARRTVELLRDARRHLRDPHLPRAPLRARDALPDRRRRRSALAAGAARGRRARRERWRRSSACRARVVARSCCRRAYLRGAFIGCGSLSRPRSPRAPRVARHERRGRATSCASWPRPRASRWACTRRRATGSSTPRAARRSAACSRRSARTAPSCGSRRRACSPGRARRPTASPTPTPATCAARPRRRRGTPTRSSRSAAPTRCRPSCATVAELRLRLPDATLAELGERGRPARSRKWAVGLAR